MKKESNIFEHGKTYRFLPCKSLIGRCSFISDIRNRKKKYNERQIWELRLKSNMFTYKGPDSEDIWVDGLILNRNWVEEVK